MDLPKLATESIHQFCTELLTNYEEKNFAEFFQCLHTSANKLLDEGTRNSVLSQVTRSVILSNFEDAFKFEYNDSNAMKAFLEYLDRRWLTMYYGAPDISNSYCGTIVQSSCTGKSRLIAEYLPQASPFTDFLRIGKNLLTPNLSLGKNQFAGQCFPPGVRIPDPSLSDMP